MNSPSKYIDDSNHNGTKVTIPIINNNDCDKFWLNRKQEISVLMAMHDLNLAARFSDTVLMLRRGSVFASGAPSDIINPVNIRKVYGVEAVVTVDNGHPHVIPREPLPDD